MLCLPMGCGGGFDPNNVGGSGGSGSNIPPKSWGFDSPANYTFNSTQVEVTGSAAKIKRVNYEVDTAGEFAAGTHYGTAYSGGHLTLVTGTATSELNAVTTPKFADLVAYWKFEGDFTDSSTESNDGTAIGDAAVDASSFMVGSGSATFDGVGDYITVADGNSLDLDLASNFTISAWVKSNSTGTSDRIVTKECFDATYIQSSFYLTTNISDGYSFGISTDGTTFSPAANTPVAFKPGEWKHVVGTYDGVNLKIYVDSVLMNTRARTGIVFNGTTDVSIGARTGSATCNVGAAYFDGNIDDVAIWKSTLSEDEVSLVYSQQKQKYFGYFDSDILDSGTPISPWPSLEWTADLPYFKELTGDVNNDGVPDSESATVANYTSLVGSSGSTSDNNLMNSLILLYRFNGLADYTGVADEVTDYARNTPALDNSGVAVGGNISSAKGMFLQGREFDGSGKSITVSSFNSNPAFTADKSFSFWLKINPTQADTTSTTNTILLDGDGTRTFKIGVHNQTALAADIGKIFIEASDGATTPTLTSTKLLNDGKFHHITIMSGGNLRLFIDGEFEGSVINSTIGTYGGAYTFNISAAVEGFSGVIDELAYWARALHFNIGTSVSHEAEQLYLRGANRIKTLVKSCIDPACNCVGFGVGGNTTDCDGDTTPNASDNDDLFFSKWLGPNNTANTFFSELHNNTSINASGEADGEVNRESPLLTFADFSGAGLSIANNQYFQFRTILESNDDSALCSGSPCLPKMKTISLGSTNYFGGVVEINNTVGHPYSTQIKSVTLDEVGGVNCSFNYQVSNNNGITWYYNNAGTWTVATLSSHVTNSADLTANIPTFHSQVGTGLFKFKLLMQSLDTTTDCNLNSFIINF